MQKIVLLFVLIISLLGCTPKSQNTNQEPQREYLIKVFLDKFLSENRNCFNNDVTKKDCELTLKNEFLKNLGDSIPCISELPLEFEMLIEYENDIIKILYPELLHKYVVKFSFSETRHNIKISDNYDVTFQVFAIVDKNAVLELKEGNFYYIAGSCYDFASKNSFVLPSGDYFNGYPTIYKPILDFETLYLI
jgi:hypothetical protein